MINLPPPPICFVAMPFGKKSPPGKKKAAIDFDRVFEFIQKAIQEANLECVRADTETAGGFVQSSMYESLLIGEYVVADLTLANPNVTYEIGVRHGARANSTFLLCAENYMSQLPFDLKPFRVHVYKLEGNGKINDENGEKLKNNLKSLLQKAIAGELAADNPIAQLAQSSTPAEHEKTDAFIQRMRFASEIGQKVHDALNKADHEQALNELKIIENDLIRDEPIVVQLHTALISLLLGYREKKAYEQMVALYEKLPKELQRMSVVLEQIALAVNRLAEKSAEDKDWEKAKRFRVDALGYLEKVTRAKWSSETYGIAGRIYKGQMNAEHIAGNTDAAKGVLKKAIEMYEQGFRADPRDYYPGVNAVTLRLQRSSQEDVERLLLLLPAVRFSVERAPIPKDEKEKYWQEATKLELACAGKDWGVARIWLQNVLVINVENWFRETTIDNLEILKNAFKEDAEAVKNLDEIIDKLKP